MFNVDALVLNNTLRQFEVGQRIIFECAEKFPAVKSSASCQYVKGEQLEIYGLKVTFKERRSESSTSGSCLCFHRSSPSSNDTKKNPRSELRILKPHFRLRLRRPFFIIVEQIICVGARATRRNIYFQSHRSGASPSPHFIIVYL